jgi:hypothetical protein
MTKVELRTTTIVLEQLQPKPKLAEVVVNLKLLKLGHKVLESMSRRTIVPEGGFEAVLTISSPNVKGLVYLKTRIKGTNVCMLLDTRATNSFMTQKCAKRLGLVIDATVLPMKVNFMQGSYEATGVVKEVQFKVETSHFQEDFKVCDLGGVDVVLGNTFLHYYGIEIRQRRVLSIVMVGLDRKP